MTLWKNASERIERSTAEIIVIKKTGEVVAASTFLGGIKLGDEDKKWCYLDELVKSTEYLEYLAYDKQELEDKLDDAKRIMRTTSCTLAQIYETLKDVAPLLEQRHVIDDLFTAMDLLAQGEKL